MAMNSDRPQAPRHRDDPAPKGTAQGGHQYPQDSNMPLVPEPKPDEEVGIGGGAVHVLSSEFSWAEHHGEGDRGTDWDHAAAPHRPAVAATSRPVEQDTAKDSLFGEIAADHEPHRVNPLRKTSWLIDQ